MAIKLPPLPYATDALEPLISRETLEYHHGKHHAGYVEKLNALIADSDLAQHTLEDLVKVTEGDTFNNAAQVWNHDFYWQCMSPGFGEEPGAPLRQAIDEAFGSFDNLRDTFLETAGANFASGWTWLVSDANGALSVVNTDDADTPRRGDNVIPLLTADVWEHAYYIDYRNARDDYLEAFWRLVNWEFVSTNYQP